MTSSSTSEAQLKSEIARLTASINQHKLTLAAQQQPSHATSSSTYTNTNYRPSNKYVRPGLTTSSRPPPSQPRPAPPKPLSPEVKEVVLNGVAFESSGRSLMRKDLPKPASINGGSIPTTRAVPSSLPTFSRKHGRPHGQRIYKPKQSRSRNMTLTNNRRPYRARSNGNKSRKYSNKPCPRFTTTGACNRGLTCMYQHDAAKIAICWNFLQDSCPNTAETCNLSHEPTPERTPLCLHFLNKGRCTREKCPFPHVNVGARHGICRDFAVLGYCDKGLDCDKKHVRECPDFADNGTCTTNGCKLPHVIRANRNRKAAISAAPIVNASEANSFSVQPSITAEEAQLGDEYISLTFNESSDEDSEEDEESEAGSEDDQSSGEEGTDPHEAASVEAEET